MSAVFDLHCDAVLKLVHRGCRFGADNSRGQVDIPKMRKGNVTNVCFSLWSDPVFAGESAVSRTQFMLEKCLQEIEINRNDLKLILTSGDITQNGGQKIGVMLGIEGGLSINNSLPTLETFFAQGVRRMTLVNTVSTQWAGSANADNPSAPLTKMGEEVVHLMNDMGMVVDLAHACEKTFLDAVKISKRPPICSHSLCQSIFPAPRLATDRMIKALGDKGGLFAVTLMPTFFAGANQEVNNAWYRNLASLLNHSDVGSTPEEKSQNRLEAFWDFSPPLEIARIESLLPHIDHVIELIGEDQVGIGTDFDGMPFGPIGLEDASKFDNLRVAMKLHGYSEKRIAKILGLNAVRVVSDILP